MLDFYNDAATEPSGNRLAFVRKHSKNGAVVHFEDMWGLPVYNVPIPYQWSAGPRTGTLAPPAPGAHFYLQQDQGKSFSFGNPTIAANPFYNTEHEPPDHPDVKELLEKDKWGFKVELGGIRTGTINTDATAVVPGSLDLHDPQGNKFVLGMGSIIQQAQKEVRFSDKGSPITVSEQSGLKAANAMAAASQIVSKLPLKIKP